MAKAYRITVFEKLARPVSKIVRDFNNYPVWAGGLAIAFRGPPGKRFETPPTALTKLTSESQKPGSSAS